MRPTFHMQLINGPFEDPGLFISFAFEKKALLFDMGELYHLSAKDLLKVTHVFVSHTHIDHFVGFDRLLRIVLGRNKTIKLFGPPGFIANVEGKLNAYTWNLIKDHQLVLEVTEIHQNVLKKKSYACAQGLLPGTPHPDEPFSGLIVKEPKFSVFTDFLDHKIISLGFRLEEQFHVNMIKEKMDAIGLPSGPWINQFKNSLFEKKNRNSIFHVTDEKSFPLGELSDTVACISPGQKIAYITDVVYNENTCRRMIKLAKDVNVLFIESAFLDEDRALAEKKYHLTSAQAGEIGRLAGAGDLKVFHFSTRYMHKGHLLVNEARQAFEGDSYDS
ncbi:ribonuclease Z [Candidatus Magnetomorum sp. HK-1]|nr:ribonuclease Z [Candidatus Magnetomorum sp. HK-1]